MKKIKVLILTMGLENHLRTNADEKTELYTYFATKEFQDSFKNLEKIYVLPTPEAFPLYNKLAEEGQAVVLFAHTTC